MTQIAFHFNAPDKLHYACRVARKAQRQGQRLVITGPAATLAVLDEMLWNLTPQDFIAHCNTSASPELLQASPVLLTPDARHTTPTHRQVLLHVGDTLPVGFEQFERLIEVVSTDEHDRQQARVRWRSYQQQGHSIVRHDLAAQGT